MKSILIFIKGSCRNITTGDIGIGMVVYECENLSFTYKNTSGIFSKYDSSKLIIQEHEIIPQENSSIILAEHLAIKKVLSYILDNDFKEKIYVLTESSLAVEQVYSHSKIKKGLYVDVAKENVSNLIDMQEADYNIEFIWIPSKYNTKACKLSESAF